MGRESQLPTGIVKVARKKGTKYRVWIPSRKSGRKRWLAVCPTLAEAVKMREAAMQQKDLLSQHQATFGEVADTVASEYRQGHQDGMLNWFEGKQRLLEGHFGRDALVALVTPQHLEEYRDKLLNGGCSASTVRHHRRALGLVFKSAIRRKLMTADPTLEVRWPRVKVKPFPYLPPARIVEVLAGLDVSKAVIVEMLFQTGLRRAEAARVTLEDLQPEGLLVRGKVRDERLKLGNRGRQLIEESLEILRGTEAQRIGQVDRAFKQARKLDSRMSPHAMRHSYAMALRESGKDIYEVQKLMRHASIQQTTQYFKDDGIQAVDDLLA